MCSGLRRGPCAARRSARLKTASSSPKGPAARASLSGGWSVRPFCMKPIFRCRAVRVTARSAGSATSWSRAARRSPSTRPAGTLAPRRPSSSSSSTRRTTSRTWSRVSRWWYGLPSRPRARESSGTASRKMSVSKGGSRASKRAFRKSTDLPLASGLLAARVRVRAAPEGARVLGVALRAGGLLRTLLPGLLHAAVLVALDKGVDERKDEKEDYGVDQEASDLGPASQPEGLREGNAED